MELSNNNMIISSFAETNQSTIPRELPIKGSETEIGLAIQSETHRFFRIKGKRLVLIRPLDRDVSVKCLPSQHKKMIAG